MIPLHAALLADGRVMSYGSNGWNSNQPGVNAGNPAAFASRTTANGKQTGLFIYDIWDPTVGSGDEAHLTLPNTTNTDLFCSAQMLLPGGRMLLTGGDQYDQNRVVPAIDNTPYDYPSPGAGEVGWTTNRGSADVNLFNPVNNSLEKLAPMVVPRWYGTLTMLGNGEIYIQGGADGNWLAEVRAADGRSSRQLSIITQDLEALYPKNFLNPVNGHIFGMAFTQIYDINTANGGTRTDLGVLNHMTIDQSTTATMFRPGLILVAGGENERRAIVIDIRNPLAPQVFTLPSMSRERAWVISTILPDGKVLLSGGSKIQNTTDTPGYHIEIFDPAGFDDLRAGIGGGRPVWIRDPAASFAPGNVPSASTQMRLYHSNQLLLPDGSVLTGGGGAPGPVTNLNAELYYPPYLFTAAGNLATRPTIESAPVYLNRRATFSVTTPNAASIRRVTLLGSGSATHSLDMNQRFSELTFTRSGNVLNVQLPNDAGLPHETPPGYYLLHLIDDAGVPSVARILQIGPS